VSDEILNPIVTLPSTNTIDNGASKKDKYENAYFKTHNCFGIIVVHFKIYPWLPKTLNFVEYWRRY